jgi:hypothetical protein
MDTHNNGVICTGMNILVCVCGVLTGGFEIRKKTSR